MLLNIASNFKGVFTIEISRGLGPITNPEKTKTMVVDKAEKLITIRVQGQAINKLINKYCGGLITKDGYSRKDIQRLIRFTSQAFLENAQDMEKQKNITKKTKSIMRRWYVHHI